MILPINQTDQPGAKSGRGRREKNSDRKQVGKMMFVFYKQNREHKSTVTEKADSGSLCVRLYEIGNLALMTFQPFFFCFFCFDGCVWDTIRSDKLICLCNKRLGKYV